MEYITESINWLLSVATDEITHLMLQDNVYWNDPAVVGVVPPANRHCAPGQLVPTSMRLILRSCSETLPYVCMGEAGQIESRQCK